MHMHQGHMAQLLSPFFDTTGPGCHLPSPVPHQPRLPSSGAHHGHKLIVVDVSVAVPVHLPHDGLHVPGIDADACQGLCECGQQRGKHSV